MDGVALKAPLYLPTHLPDPSPSFLQDASSFIPPPPPPPPLPPPPPPPPPPAPPTFGEGPFSRNALRRSKMRSFNWDTIPQHSVIGKRNVWTSCRKLEEFELDTECIEELFSHSERQRGPLKHGTVKKSVWSLQKATPESEMVSILNSKKSMNIGILLKQFKRPMQDIVEDIRQGNVKFAAGRLRELSKLLPDDNELRQLLSFKGDESQLPEGDRFFLMLVKVPGYEERLKCLLLREEFIPFIEEMKNSVSIMTAAANELLACDDLHSIIRLVLKAGNYMNAGGYAGRALGFRMTSLLRLVDTKANKPGMNLMHYVAMQAQQIDSALLNFPEQLQHIRAASRIQKQEVETDFQKEMAKITEANHYSTSHPDLQDQIDEFLQMAKNCLAEIQACLTELDSISHSVAEYFCEDPATFKLEECCSIFQCFCEKFEKAVQENKEREAVERRRRQQREREALSRAAKRRSVNTCSTRDLGTDSLESVLTSFIMVKPQRRRQLSSNKGRLTEMLEKSNLLVQSDPTSLDGSVNVKPDISSYYEELQEQDQNCHVNLNTSAWIKQKDNTNIEECPEHIETCQVTITSPKKTEPNEFSGSEGVQEQNKICLLIVNSPETTESKESSVSHGEDHNNKNVLSALNAYQSPAGPKRAPCIEDIRTPKSSRRRSIIKQQDHHLCGEDSGENAAQEIKQDQKPMNPVQQDLQEPCHNNCSVQNDVGLKALYDSPCRKHGQKVDLAFVNGFGSPWTVLSPQISPAHTHYNRYSFNANKNEEPDDGVWALPDTPVRAKGPLLPHACKSYEHSLSTPVLTDAGMRDSPLRDPTVQGNLLRSASVGETPNVVPSFRFGALFPRRNRREAKRQEPSALKSFFQRFGEKGRPASTGE